MSKDRKRRLRKLTSAMLGALGMAGSVANINTNADVQQETTSLLAKTGIVAGITSGLGLLGLTTYNTLKGTDPLEKEYRELVLKNQKDKMEDEKKDKEIKKRKEELLATHGISDNMANIAAQVLNWIRDDNQLTGPKLLDLCDDNDVCEVIKEAGNGQYDGNAIKRAMSEISKQIKKHLDIKKIQNLCEALNETEEGKTTKDNISVYGMRLGNHNSDMESRMQLQTTSQGAQQAVVNGGIAVSMVGTGQRATAAQIKAGNAILTDSLKKILGNRFPATIPITSLYTRDGKGGANAVGFYHRGATPLTRNMVFKSWNRGDSTAATGGMKALTTHTLGNIGKLGMQILLGKDVNFISKTAAQLAGDNYENTLKTLEIITINNLTKETCPELRTNKAKAEANAKLFQAARSAVEDA